VSEPIRLYLDEDANDRSLVAALRSRGIDVLTPPEANLMAASDGVQLDYATRSGRIIFTYNVRDFARLHAEYLSAGQHHTGIIVSEQAPVGVTMRRLLKLINTRAPADMHNWLEYLSNWH
jgi:hypothetical protein